MANYINGWINNFDNFLDQKNVLTEILQMMEEKTNVKKRYLAMVITSLIAIYLAVGYAAALVCNALGFVYPAYVSIKAIESPDPSDDTKWLMYWVVFATFSCIEFFSDIVLSWFPFYFLAKCVFLLWCMADVQYNGSVCIYKSILKPLFKEHEAEIDAAIINASNSAKSMLGQMTGRAMDAASTTATVTATASATVARAARNSVMSRTSLFSSTNLADDAHTPAASSEHLSAADSAFSASPRADSLASDATLKKDT